MAISFVSTFPSRACVQDTLSTYYMQSNSLKKHVERLEVEKGRFQCLNRCEYELISSMEYDYQSIGSSRLYS
jgi:hypothetical protein